MEGLRPMCPVKHAQSWGVSSGTKRVGGRGYTKLNNSRKSTEQGLNFPFCCSRFFNQDLKITTKMKRQESPKWQFNWVNIKPENHHMAIHLEGKTLGQHKPRCCDCRKVAQFQWGPHMWNIFQPRSDVISGTRMTGESNQQQTKRQKGGCKSR